MRAITALHLRKKLGQVLDEAAAGERILIERDHRPLAVLVPYEEGARLEESLRESPKERARRTLEALDALEALDRFRERMAREHPETLDRPDAVELLRLDRSRDEPGFDEELIRPPKRASPEKSTSGD
ncbi:MAG: type II toxin-antitoxin system prevent-host-death family antitoxin [Chloroflexi bacterium]|nr:type II toxin-antitoxin system prevent-host-death family antitoxin [Chloroflexota bacterium]